MKAYKREIVIFILTALATLSAVCYFFGDMKEGKDVAQTDLYTLTATAPEAILAVNRPSVFARIILTKTPVYQAFASGIPEIFLTIIQKTPEIPSLHFSFHPQGVIMYAKANKNMAGHIEENVLKTAFRSFAPQQQIKGDVTFTYYPDTGNRFFGYYQQNGIWVASYSKKLLEEVAGIQQKQKNVLTDGQKQLRKTLDSNAPLNLMIQSNLLDLYVEANDSILWRISNSWLGADIFESEGNICFFSSLPHHEPADTLFKTLADTLAVRLEEKFPQLHITNQIYEENGKVYYTGCTGEQTTN